MTQNPFAEPLILASQSPIRARLLSDAGLAFTIRPVLVDEADIIRSAAGAAAEELAGRLAGAKAFAVAAIHPDCLVIGADQILEHDGEILAKPRDRAEAFKRLRRLSGSSHRLVTSLALVRDGTLLLRHTETARLTMHELTSAECHDLLERDGDLALQSVGAYRLEGPGIALFRALDGDYFSMLGLPLLPLLCALRREGAGKKPGVVAP